MPESHSFRRISQTGNHRTNTSESIQRGGQQSEKPAAFEFPYRKFFL